ncbi:hypothetical protein [Aquimarina agarivorans]|uniref:hypothetical protein n=1 Tax=Aquimarina agarivorans TaxID=980584 RepID=UPI00030BC1A5|nr:hypothetical protein [Aquimarina agarivorans]
MKRFILKALLFFSVVVGIFSMILLFYGSYVDYFYEKFTSPKASSMIIGDSRALQGIQPQVINQNLVNQNISLPMFNYSFTIAQSHIGPLYRKSILKKIDKKTTNGLFILALNPWMFGSKKTNNNYKGEFKELGQPPHNMNYVSMNPNFEYLIKNLNFFHFKGVFRKSSKLHKNGWLEETNLPSDQNVFNDWKNNQLKIFNGFIKNYKVSKYRMKSLDTLVKNLKKYGEIAIVRTPIDEEMLNLEKTFFKDFDKFMYEISESNNIHYFNFTQSNLKNIKLMMVII